MLNRCLLYSTKSGTDLIILCELTLKGKRSFLDESPQVKFTGCPSYLSHEGTKCYKSVRWWSLPLLNMIIPPFLLLILQNYNTSGF